LVRTGALPITPLSLSYLLGKEDPDSGPVPWPCPRCSLALASSLQDNPSLISLVILIPFQIASTCAQSLHAVNPRW
jgi:hypothetical protein